jgi:hypothetical protein
MYGRLQPLTHEEKEVIEKARYALSLIPSFPAQPVNTA